MITGPTDWNTALNAQQKQPLYVLAVPGLSLAIASFAPALVTGGGSLISGMTIPKGAAQRIDELTGHSTISNMTIQCIDPTGDIAAASIDETQIGQYAEFRMGFPGMAYADFVPMHTGRIGPIERTSEGRWNIPLMDLLMNLVSDVFLNGGPDAWIPGQAKNAFPLLPPAVLDNAVPISEDNPRYLSGHPMDILLAVMQNELGIGQTDPPVLVINSSDGSGTGMAGYGINPTWTFYDAIDPGTLITPNPYIDTDAVLAFRDGQFARLRMEFTITSTADGKSWIEDNILKPLGLYWITKANGKLTLKSMKHPIAPPTTTALTRANIIGIPDTNRLPIINMIQATLPAKATGANSGDEASTRTLPFVQQRSVAKYKATYVHQVNADGFRLGLGGYGQLFLLANRIFNRHAFGTPEYTIKTYFKNIVLELGDFILLTHSLIFDLVGGSMGITGVLCEITDRQPDYANGGLTLKVIDTRFITVPNGNFVVADTDSAIPDWPSAGADQLVYMFVTDDTGHQTNADPGNQIS